jgi:hypothetical protein
MNKEEQEELHESGTELIRHLFDNWYEVLVGYNDFYDCPFCKSYVNKECLMKEGIENMYIHFSCAMELYEALKVLNENDDERI